MKKFIITLIAVTAILVSCKKSTTNAIGTNLSISNDNGWIYVDECDTIQHNGTDYKVCFDSLLHENRCPDSANCVYAGYAQARFKCTIGSTVHTIKLATDTGNGLINDTTIAGVNFKLDSLLPHPSIYILYPYSAIKAKIIVSH